MDWYCFINVDIVTILLSQNESIVSSEYHHGWYDNLRVVQPPFSRIYVTIFYWALFSFTFWLICAWTISTISIICFNASWTFFSSLAESELTRLQHFYFFGVLLSQLKLDNFFQKCYCTKSCEKIVNSLSLLIRLKVSEKLSL